MACPRCGLPGTPGGGPFCPRCGAHLPALRWVAEPPPSARRPPAPPVASYRGPPRYAVLPRWGFPPLPWRPAEQSPPAPADPAQAVAIGAQALVPMLWATAALSGLAAVAEAWRYGLLLLSRDRALSADAVAASDALVSSAGYLAVTLAVLAGILLVRWSISASRAAAAIAGVRPSRPPHTIVLGWVAPGANLTIPGSLLAEIEHAALRRPVHERPRPSRLVLVWWLLWAAGVVLAAIVVLWSLREGVQARADGVVLHALLDALAAGTAGCTAVLVARMTRLVGPVRPVEREILVRSGARNSASTGSDAG